MNEGGISALLFIPMVFQDRTVGLLEMRTFHNERGFTDHEISLAHLLANQAASAIQNAKLYEQAQSEIDSNPNTSGTGTNIGTPAQNGTNQASTNSSSLCEALRGSISRFFALRRPLFDCFV